MSSASVSVAIPTFRRTQRVLDTLTRVLACDPAPAEVLVHVDAGDDATPDAVRSAFPGLRVFWSDRRVGPGGGRSRLIAEARHPVVASFDDDSYPVEGDYFARLLRVFERYPDAAVVAAAVQHPGDGALNEPEGEHWAAGFVGCACAYRREAFLETGGYEPLPDGYGMEEVDLSLRLIDAGRGIVFAPALRVLHDTPRRRQAEAAITAAFVRNTALHAWLRYPLSAAPLGAAQYANQLRWRVMQRRWAGLVRGVVSTPGHLWRHRGRRDRVSVAGLRRYRRLRKRPIPARPGVPFVDMLGQHEATTSAARIAPVTAKA